MSSRRIKKQRPKPKSTRIIEVKGDPNAQLLLEALASKLDQKVFAKLRADVRSQIDELPSFQFLTDGSLPANQTLGLMKKLTNDPNTGIEFFSSEDHSGADGLHLTAKDLIGVNTDATESNAHEYIISMIFNGLPDSYTILFHEVMHRFQTRARKMKKFELSPALISTIASLLAVLFGMGQVVFRDVPHDELLPYLFIAAALLIPETVETIRAKKNRLSIPQRILLDELHAYFAQGSIVSSGTHTTDLDFLDPNTLSTTLREYDDIYPDILEELGIEEEGFDQMISNMIDEFAILKVAGTTHRQFAQMIAHAKVGDVSIDGFKGFTELIASSETVSPEEAISTIKDHRNELRFEIRRLLATQLIKTTS